MSESSDEGDGVDEEVPDAVREWLSSVAADRGVSETELLESLLAGDAAGGREAAGVDSAELQRVERDFRELVEDVRDRIVQVKRETDGKAAADHTHHDLQSTLEQLGREVGAIEAEVERVDERLADGFENYEEILTYLTEATDALDRKLGRLASAVIDLRERVGDAARDEVRRTALAHLTDTANRHGIEKAKCDHCGEGVHVGMLVQPRCPHCDSSFSSLEPKSGFFRSSVLHTGTMPALESAPGDTDSEAEALEAMVEDAAQVGEAAPAFEMEPDGPQEAEEPTGSAAVEDPWEEEAEPMGAADVEQADEPTERDAGGDDRPERDGLESIDGIGQAYADRLVNAGIDDLLALAVADPADLAEAIDVPEATVADWVEQADARTGT